MGTSNDNVEEKNVVVFPTVPSAAQFQDELEIAIRKFIEANPDVTVSIMVPFIVSSMLMFPYSWVQQLKQPPEDFVKLVSQEAELIFKKMSEDGFVNINDIASI